MNVSVEQVLQVTQLQQKIDSSLFRFNIQNLLRLSLYSYTVFEQLFSII